MTQPTATRTRPGALRQFHQPATPGLPPLVIFPHAGSGASSYRALSGLLASRFTVLIMQYPGRQDRMREPSATSLGELAQEALDEFVAAGYTGPVTSFGHSMGATVAFEFAHRAEAAGVPVARLVASAAAAPSKVADLPPHPYDDEGILANLQALEGTGGSVMGSDAVMRMALPVLRGDYRAFDSYSCGPDVRISAPVVVVGGADDPVIKPHHLHHWGSHAEHVQVSVVDGSHFYLNEKPEAVLDALTCDLDGNR
ncbi:MAG TPA: alpha/beta fold hydrolase [Gordonia sp. (in: high G+C Gram-positive bacteria)]|uniref:thioesterase II family protein n=1 Tax=unclassified Gordonia (in: high G+C Gram-positive bacteria) TaxID=2657482 RepID=UPI000FB806AE|nr:MULTISPECIES: alpha/beta fold hydrolase [unclassified Gordonia (in: high G+C Gram-positive bacteria)]RUP37229.1 MAG: thioesterase [Gordonia sp. (in: high G+C Gram-positive bacteria)]HNP56281.1 alpha/beta fold hydrolase [Gordonia sp. (in: high G+C Gram-positive bacteria)]HRC51898.1 alpha/beta fold hydrolase [Gordonia sp. (in: high G+C Gram-positive bacteria)]